MTLHTPLKRAPLLRILCLGTAMTALGACSFSDMDWDLRRNSSSLNTSDAAQNATANRPEADQRGVISYPGYQVAIARRDDTVAGVASRVGLDPAEVARYNALKPEYRLRAGEVLALPRRVAEPTAVTAPQGRHHRRPDPDNRY